MGRGLPLPKHNNARTRAKSLESAVGMGSKLATRLLVRRRLARRRLAKPM